MSCPCKDCKGRHAGYHSGCKDYEAYRAELDARIAEAEKEKQLLDACAQLHNHRYHEVHKKANLRRFKKT